MSTLDPNTHSEQSLAIDDLMCDAVRHRETLEGMKNLPEEIKNLISKPKRKPAAMRATR